MAKKEMAVKVLTVDGAVYLGELKKEKDEIIISKAICLGTPSVIEKRHLVAYLEAQTLDTLTSITIGGNGSSYSTRDLDEALALEFEILSMKLQQATLSAPKKLVANEFKSLV